MWPKKKVELTLPLSVLSEGEFGPLRLGGAIAETPDNPRAHVDPGQGPAHLCAVSLFPLPTLFKKSRLHVKPLFLGDAKSCRHNPRSGPRSKY